MLGKTTGSGRLLVSVAAFNRLGRTLPDRMRAIQRIVSQVSRRGRASRPAECCPAVGEQPGALGRSCSMRPPPAIALSGRQFVASP